ncbi:uncharacterized protein LOC124813752 [Hydra vulgaris]|uniref:uncharacterized protein LOC124813752 n=1 Tax=Hydra vulgaris TaxID=6087 RepID=UPI001F5F79BF|nr:uncharacterized protein LOC124813752 [Hydra vulgaris]
MLSRIQVVSNLCQCLICSLARDTRSNIEMNLREFIDPISPQEKKSSPNSSSYTDASMCGDCFRYIGRDIRNPCNKKSTAKNLEKIIMSKNLKLSECVTSKILKTIIGDEKQGKVKLSTCGTSLHVHLREIISPKKISLDTVFNIKKLHDLPECVIKSMLTEIRKDVDRSGFETNVEIGVNKKSHSINQFYCIQQSTFQQGTNHTEVQKDLVYVESIPMLVDEICKQRDIVLQESIVRIGIDGGQGSIKVVMNLF